MRKKLVFFIIALLFVLACNLGAALPSTDGNVFEPSPAPGNDSETEAQNTNQRALSEKVLFSSDEDGDDEIFIMNPDGSGLEKLTDNDWDDYYPSLSPDGTRIVFASEGGPDGDGLFMMDADGSHIHQLASYTTAGYSFLFRGVQWSPNANEIAYSLRGNTIGLYLMDIDDPENPELLVSETVTFSWSPDGKNIVYTSQNGDGLYTINVKNLKTTPLIGPDDIGTGLSFFSPAWSPDGKSIIFVAYEDDDELTHLYITTPKGAKPYSLISKSGYYSHPIWSHDSQFLAFTSWVGDYTGNIWRIDRDGENMKQLTEASGASIASDWGLTTAIGKGLADISQESTAPILPDSLSYPVPKAVFELPTQRITANDLNQLSPIARFYSGDFTGYVEAILSADGSKAAISDASGTFVLDVASGELAYLIAKYRAAAISEQGNYLLLNKPAWQGYEWGGQDASYVWDVQQGKVIAELELLSDNAMPADAYIFAPGENSIYGNDPLGNYEWDVKTGRLLRYEYIESDFEFEVIGSRINRNAEFIVYERGEPAEFGGNVITSLSVLPFGEDEAWQAEATFFPIPSQQNLLAVSADTQTALTESPNDNAAILSNIYYYDLDGNLLGSWQVPFAAADSEWGWDSVSSSGAWISPDGNQVGVVSDAGFYYLWDSTGQLLKSRQLADYNSGFRSTEISDDGRYFLVDALDSIDVWDLESGERAHHFSVSSATEEIVLGHDVVVAQSYDELAVFQLSTGDLLKKIPVVGSRFSVSPDGNYLASIISKGEDEYGSRIPGFEIFDLATLEATDLGTVISVDELDGPFALSQNAQYLFVDIRNAPELIGKFDSGLRVLDLNAGGQSYVFSDFDSRLDKLSLSPDGKYLIAVADSSESSGTIWVINIENMPASLANYTAPGPPTTDQKVAALGEMALEISNLSSYANYDITYDAYSELIAIADEGSVQVWSLITGELVLEYQNDDLYFPEIAFMEEGALLLVENLVLDVKTGAVLNEYELPVIGDLIFSPDGTFLITTDDVITYWGVR